jgi:hypothetical protein
MARIYVEDGFQVHLWPNDHAPAHVHIYRGEGLAIINLATLELRAAYDMKPPDVRRSMEIAQEYRVRFLKEWRRMHG